MIIWENLSFTRWDRNKRKVATTFGALLLIVISLIMVFSSKYLEETATNNGSSQSNLCPESFGDWTKDDQRNFVDDNPSELYCYCDQFSTIGQAADSYCRDYLRKNIQSQVLLYFASMIVLAVNFAIDKAINFSSSYEKHHTSDGKGMSMFMRIFILKFINTAAVFLINNNNVVLQRVFGVEAPSTAEFSSDWYNQIGTTIILVQLGDIFNAHAGKVYNSSIWSPSQYDKCVCLCVSCRSYDEIPPLLAQKDLSSFQSGEISYTGGVKSLLGRSKV